MTKRGQLTFYLPSNLPQLKCIKKNRLALNLEVKYGTKTYKVQLKLSMQQLSCKRPALVMTTLVKPRLNRDSRKRPPP